MPVIKVRKGTEKDLPTAFELIKELAQFENAPQEVVTSVEQMAEDGFGTSKVFHSLVATIDNKIIGVAIYFIMYSTWKGKCIYLDDLIINEQYRRQGAGTMLFETLLKEGRKMNIKEIKWQVLEWNESAINFYKKYNTVFDSEWVNCKLMLGGNDSTKKELNAGI